MERSEQHYEQPMNDRGRPLWRRSPRLVALLGVLCLAQDSAQELRARIDKGEYGAVLELGKLDDKAQVPYLRKIKEKPGLSDDWKTVLRMALARLGDEESFQEIVEPLNRPNRLTHQPVFDQLVYVGGKRTIAFLYKLLDSDPGLRMDGDMILPSLAYRAVVTLSHLVSDPPVQEGRMRSPTESATKEYVRIWKEWFAKHPELLK